MSRRIRAITLDLDDTLWPVWPTIERAEARLHAHLQAHAPAVAHAFDVPAMRALRDAVMAEDPLARVDLRRARRRALERAFEQAGADADGVEAALEVFMAERQRVEFYPDALPALERLAARFPLVALTNGNADVHAIGIGAHFVACVGAAELGIAKPDPRIFRAALDRLGLEPERVLHVGDDAALDVEGARAAGLQAAWINRHGRAWPHATPEPWSGAGLDVLVDWLEREHDAQEGPAALA